MSEFMMADGTFQKLPKDMQARLKTDFLIVRGYAKGIPFKDEEFYAGCARDSPFVGFRG